MHYHVAQNGTKFGPFDRDEVYSRLVAGELKPTDLGWHEGLAEWEPLSKLIPPPQSADPVFAASGVFVPASASPVGNAFVPPGKSSGMAVASMICGILGMLLWLPCIPAVILGHLALSAIKNSAGALTGKGMAITGLVTGYLMIIAIPIVAILAAMAVPAFNAVQQKAHQVKAMNNAKQLVFGLKQYAADHSGSYPPTLDVLFDEKILIDPKLLEFPESANFRGQEWEYHGAELTDRSPGNAILLITKKPDRAKKKIIARNDGSVAVEGARE